MILIPNFGFILADIKYKKIHPLYKTYPLDSIETKKYSSLQRKFNLHIWYVLSNEESDFKTWLWIPVSKVLEAGVPKFISSVSKEDFSQFLQKNLFKLQTLILSIDYFLNYINCKPNFLYCHAYICLSG